MALAGSLNVTHVPVVTAPTLASAAPIGPGLLFQVIVVSVQAVPAALNIVPPAGLESCTYIFNSALVTVLLAGMDVILNFRYDW